MALLVEDRLFPAESRSRDIARSLYADVRDLPIISPHGHTDPRWYAENKPFPNPAELFVTPDHYVFRMLYSQGIDLDDLGVRRADGTVGETDPRAVWRLFAQNYHLFRGTPSRLWLVKESTDGRLCIVMYHSAQRGEKKGTIEQTPYGVIDTNRVS